MAYLGLLLFCAFSVALKASMVPIVDDVDDVEDVETNKTIDEILSEANSGVSGSTDNGLILTEYDLLLTPEQYNSLHGLDKNGPSKRNAIKKLSLRWPQKTMIYNVVRNQFTKKQVYGIQKAQTQIERYTCVKINERKTERNYVYIQNGNGCNSQLGMVNWGAQPLRLSSRGCRYRGLYVHEMLHAIGVIHEHQRPDRDDHINIYWNNVQPALTSAFTKYAASALSLNNVEYELASVMHYGTKAFSKNQQATLLPKDLSKEKYIGRVYLKGISYTDVKSLNLMYNCADHCPNQQKCGNDGFLDQNCNCICRDGSTDCDPDRKATVPANCKNTHYNSWDCYRWAAEDECDKNPVWMKANCQRACGVCGDQTTNPGGVCKDEHPRCLKWKVRGECVTNPMQSEKQCTKTCNLCNGQGATRPETNCVNTHSSQSDCDKWARAGECQMNPPWMTKNCAKSCQTCNLYSISCSNKYGDDTKCEGWASAGECQNNPTWMLPNCKLACNACDY